jgi:hypothetical protein
LALVFQKVTPQIGPNIAPSYPSVLATPIQTTPPWTVTC